MRKTTASSALAVGMVGAAVGYAALGLAARVRPMPAALREAVEASGVAHPVTSVLLAVRGYDTWLELVVLALAAVAVAGVRPPGRPPDALLARDPLVIVLLAVLLPAMALVAGYLLEAGSDAPGGAFQAGAVLASALVLLNLCGRAGIEAMPALLYRVALVLGAGCFCVTALTGLALEGAFLAYPDEHATAVILGLEIAAMLSIAAALTAAVNGQLGAEATRTP